MTAFTSTQTGLFSANSTWGGSGHPSVNGDTFSIVSPHVVTFDSDTSGLTLGFGASSIASGATLQFQTSAGSYYLQMNGNLSGAGNFYMNNGVGTAYPVGVTGQYFQRAGTFSITGAVDIRCVEPTHVLCKLSVAANAGDTVLNVDTNLTTAGDSGTNLWTNGSFVRIDNVNKAAQSEQQTISSVSSNQVTLQAGLTNAKLIGSYIILLTRNVKVLTTGNISVFTAAGSSTSYIAAEFRNTGAVNGTAIVNSPASLSYGGTFSNFATGFSGTNQTLILNCQMTGNTTACSWGTGGKGNTINGYVGGCSVGKLGGSTTTLSSTGIVSGCGRGWDGTQTGGNFGAHGDVLASGSLMNGNNQAVVESDDISVYGIVQNNTSGLAGCSGWKLYSTALFQGNSSSDLNTPGSGTGYGAQLNSATALSGNTNAGLPDWNYVELIDNGGVSGAYAAYTKGGTVQSTASPVYDASRSRSYALGTVSATKWNFMKREVLVPAKTTISVRCYVQKDTAGIAAGNLPRLWITRSDKEPLYAGSPDSETIMTDSLNTWEVLNAKLTNSTTEDWLYDVLMLFRGNSGNAYFDPIIRVSGIMQPADMEGLMVA